MTLKHSQQNPDNLTFSQLDFLAKICPLQEDKEELMTKQDQDYSTKVSGYLGKFDLDLPYLKTCEIYSLTKRGKPSKKSSFKLPKQGMMLNGQLFQQKIWEPVILESESGSLPTPRANPAMSQNLNLPSIKNHQHPNLETVISQLPTPTNQTAGKGEFLKTLVTKDGKPARIGERAYNPKTGKHVQITLDRAIELLPTPTTMDHLPQRGIESMKKQAQIHRKGRTKLANLREAVKSTSSRNVQPFSETSDFTNSDCSGTQSNSESLEKPIWKHAFLNSKERRTLSPDWTGYVSEPSLCRGDDGLRGRVARLKALGNSIVPQCAAVPLQRIKDLNEELW